MKILISANNYPTPKYPFQAFIGVLCRELVSQGHEVTVVAPQDLFSCLKNHIEIVPQDYYDTFDVDGISKEIRIVRPFTIGLGGGRFKRVTAYFFKSAINRVKNKLGSDYDVVYCHFWYSAYKMIDYVRSTGLPVIVATGEDVIYTNFTSKKSDLEFLKNVVKGVVCVSTKNLDESINKSLTIRDKCEVFPNAIDSKIFYKKDKKQIREELGYKKDDFIVAFCGRFSNRKGLFRLDDALKSINNKKIKAIYIGLPSEGERKMPSYQHILHCGPLSHNEICNYLNASDLFVLPSLAEGCSNSIVEALACGLPVISSDLPFNYDVLDVSNSILVNPNDIDEIKTAILRIYNDRELQNRLSKGALDKASSLNIKQRVNNIVKFIKLKISTNESN